MAFPTRMTSTTWPYNHLHRAHLSKGQSPEWRKGNRLTVSLNKITASGISTNIQVKRINNNSYDPARRNCTLRRRSSRLSVRPGLNLVRWRVSEHDLQCMELSLPDCSRSILVPLLGIDVVLYAVTGVTRGSSMWNSQDKSIPIFKLSRQSG